MYVWVQLLAVGVGEALAELDVGASEKTRESEEGAGVKLRQIIEKNPQALSKGVIDSDVYVPLGKRSAITKAEVDVDVRLQLWIILKEDTSYAR